MRLSMSTNIMVLDKDANYSVSMEDSMRACVEAGYEYLDAKLIECFSSVKPSGERVPLSWVVG